MRHDIQRMFGHMDSIEKGVTYLRGIVQRQEERDEAYPMRGSAGYERSLRVRREEADE